MNMCTILFSYIYFPFDMGIREKEQQKNTKKCAAHVQNDYGNEHYDKVFVVFFVACRTEISLTFFFILNFNRSERL